MNVALFLKRWAKCDSTQPAIALGTTVVYRYSDLYDHVSCLAGGLIAYGLTPGDKVAIVMRNSPEYFACLFSCWHAGLTVVPINAKLHAKEVEYILSHSESKLCFINTDHQLNTAFSDVSLIEVPSKEYRLLSHHNAVEITPTLSNDIAWLFYTSGTTGRPKAARLSFRNLLMMCHCYISDIDDVPPWQSILHPAPLSHGSGLYALAHLMKGSCQVIPESGGFDEDEIFTLITAWPQTVFFAAPTMINQLTRSNSDVDMANLKSIIYGGAPMHVIDIKNYLDRFGAKLSQLYGQGESPMTITGMGKSIFQESDHPRWEARIASAGLPQSGVEVKVVDSNGHSVPLGSTGEVICRSDCVMAGYWKNPEATAAALRDGWLWTGDLGYLDSEGFLTLQDRSKDLIISGGSNIYPREIEEILLRDNAVSEVSVIGTPNVKWGENVVAYIVVKRGVALDLDRLDQLCLHNIARFKRPKTYRVVDALPKNNYGKVLKTHLREMELNQNQT